MAALKFASLLSVKVRLGEESLEIRDKGSWIETLIQLRSQESETGQKREPELLKFEEQN